MSILVTYCDVYDWVRARSNFAARQQLVNIAYSYPVKLFYITKTEIMGCRYVINSWEYMDGFNALEIIESFQTFLERKEKMYLTKLELINLVSEYCLLNKLTIINYDNLMNTYNYLITEDKL